MHFIRTIYQMILVHMQKDIWLLKNRLLRKFCIVFTLHLLERLLSDTNFLIEKWEVTEEQEIQQQARYKPSTSWSSGVPSATTQDKNGSFNLLCSFFF